MYQNYKTEDGIELVINQETGETFATLAGYSRMSGVAYDTVKRRYQRLNCSDNFGNIIEPSDSETLAVTGLQTRHSGDIAEVNTTQGIRKVKLIDEDLITKWIISDNPELAKVMLKAGVRLYIYGLAGYKVTVEPAMPQTYLEALKKLVETVEENEKLKQQNAILADMNDGLEKDCHRQAEIIDELFDYSSIIRVANFNDCSEKNFNWRYLKSASDKMGIEVKKAPCPRYGQKNLYHHDVWRYCYPDSGLPETTTLTISK